MGFAGPGFGDPPEAVVQVLAAASLIVGEPAGQEIGHLGYCQRHWWSQYHYQTAGVVGVALVLCKLIERHSLYLIQRKNKLVKGNLNWGF